LAVAGEMPSPARDIRRQCVPDTSAFPPAATAEKIAMLTCLMGDATTDLCPQFGTSLKTRDNSVDRYTRQQKASQG
jgi:hypothetical protein